MSPLTQLERGSHKYLVPYLTAGFPDDDTFVDLAVAVAKAGADILEIGVPFSDPVADGPVIQHCGQQALDQGTDGLEAVAQLTKRVTDKVEIPVIWMGYLNPYMKYGFSETSRIAAAVGVSGMIVPDLPLEESADFCDELDKQGLVWIPLLTSTTRQDRARAMLEQAKSFAYYVAVAGVTGARETYPKDWDRPLQAFRQLDQTPVFVGFGVSGPALAQTCVQKGDGVIVGSALLDRIDRAADAAEAVKAATAFVASLRQAIDKV